MASYKLLSYDDNGATKAGIEVDGFVFNLASEIAFHGPDSGIDGSSLDTAIRRWTDLEPVLGKIANSPSTSATAIGDIKLCAPFSNPGTMYCAGANYYGHAKEMGNELDKSTIEPLFFLKSKLTSLITESCCCWCVGALPSVVLSEEASNWNFEFQYFGLFFRVFVKVLNWKWSYENFAAPVIWAGPPINVPKFGFP